jgi:hypothetical protein
MLDGGPVWPGSLIEFVAAYGFGFGTDRATIAPGSRFRVEGVDDADYSDPMAGDRRAGRSEPRLLIYVMVADAPRMIDVPCDPALIRRAEIATPCVRPGEIESAGQA